MNFADLPNADLIMKDEQLIAQITRFVKEDGFRVLKTEITDCGKTIKLDIERNKQQFTLPIKECFYDTDSKGCMTTFHGITDIRISPWYKNHLNKKRAKIN
ncbi:unnamed protein product [marine sediment metagenome]|uniref:Uncharacterized protein n=1 Tax=marine sediment metagenome TaxID=412755 RepID=X0ZZN7_9ZZZZ